MSLLFRAPTAGQLSAGLVLFRAVIGTVFLAHGAQKLFVFGLTGVGGAFAGMGVPMPQIAGPLVAFLEFFGGMALIAGLLTRPVALAFTVNMMVAMFLVHLPNGFFLPGGYEFVLTLAGASALLVIAGPGRYSVDALLARRTGEVIEGDFARRPARRAA